MCSHFMMHGQKNIKLCEIVWFFKTQEKRAWCGLIWLQENVSYLVGRCIVWWISTDSIRGLRK